MSAKPMNRRGVTASGGAAMAGVPAQLAIMVVDDDRRCLEANLAACRLLGLPRRAVVGRHFDDFLASDAPLVTPHERIFQGAIADALTHVGQLAMLRRLAGAKIKGENYSRAEIVAGRVGAEQSVPRREFD